MIPGQEWEHAFSEGYFVNRVHRMLHRRRHLRLRPQVIPQQEQERVLSERDVESAFRDLSNATETETKTLTIWEADES